MYSDAARMCLRAAELQQVETQTPSDDGLYGAAAACRRPKPTREESQ
jgi:hypothetical protein